MVADALSRKLVSLAALTDEWMLMEQFQDLNLDVQPNGETILLANMSAFEPIIISRINENQKNNPKISKIFEQITMRLGFEVVDDVLYFKGRLCVIDVDELRDEIMMEAHHTSYSIHTGSTKMF